MLVVPPSRRHLGSGPACRARGSRRADGGVPGIAERVVPAHSASIGRSGSLPANTTIVVEKPFGTDLADAKALNELIARSFDEHHVFRIDHFLAKQTILDILGFRFANRIFDPVWNSNHISRSTSPGSSRWGWRAGRATTTGRAHCAT